MDKFTNRRTRFFARYIGGAPGKFAEFMVFGLHAEPFSKKMQLDGVATDEWMKFCSHAASRHAQLQFGVLYPSGDAVLFTGEITHLEVRKPAAAELPEDTVLFTIQMSSPPARLVDKP